MLRRCSLRCTAERCLGCCSLSSRRSLLRSLTCTAVIGLLRRALGRGLGRHRLSRRLLCSRLLCSCLLVRPDFLRTYRTRVGSGDHMCHRRRARRTGGGAGGKKRDERDGDKPDTTGRNACSKQSSWVGHPTPQLDATLRCASTDKIKEIACPQFLLVGLDVSEEIGHLVPVAISPRRREDPQEPVPETHAVAVPLIRAGPEGRLADVLVRTRCWPSSTTWSR